MVCVVPRLGRRLHLEAEDQLALPGGTGGGDGPRPPLRVPLRPRLLGRGPNRVAAKGGELVVAEAAGQQVLDGQPAGRRGSDVADRDRDPGKRPGRQVALVVSAGRRIRCLSHLEAGTTDGPAGGDRHAYEQRQPDRRAPQGNHHFHFSGLGGRLTPYSRNRRRSRCIGMPTTLSKGPSILRTRLRPLACIA